MFQCLKLLIAYAPKYHWGIQITCNIILQLSKRKQSSVIIGLVERERIELMMERSSRDPLV